MFTQPHPNTREVRRIRDSYSNPRRSRGFAILSKILPTPREENAAYALLHRNRPVNQNAHLTTHNQSKFYYFNYIIIIIIIKKERKKVVI